MEHMNFTGVEFDQVRSSSRSSLTFARSPRLCAPSCPSSGCPGRHPSSTASWCSLPPATALITRPRSPMRVTPLLLRAFHANSPCADTAYILAFSIIMLNTDAHNPAVKKKMTKERWIANNRGINNGGDLPADMLERLYNSIVSNEIKLDGAVRMFSQADHKGYLTKQGGRVKSWKRRWFVLTDNCLYYFKKEGVWLTRPLASCPLLPLSGDGAAWHHSAGEPGCTIGGQGRQSLHL
jgi:hypothetical protein